MKLDHIHAADNDTHGFCSVTFDDKVTGTSGTFDVDILIEALEEFREETGQSIARVRVAPTESPDGDDYEKHALLTTEHAAKSGRVVMGRIGADK